MPRRVRLGLALVRALALMALAGQFLFAHGCHGDEDHELFGGSLGTVITANED